MNSAILKAWRARLSLGGKLSILFAALWGVMMGILLFCGDSLHYTVNNCLGLAVMGLSFPLGWLGMSGHGSPGSHFRYLLLLVPNFFLLGYSLAGLWRLLKRPEPSPAAVSSEELKRMIDDHRRQHE